MFQTKTFAAVAAVAAFCLAPALVTAASSTPSVGSMISGEIASVSSTSLVVEDGVSGRSTTVALTEDTVITLDGKTARATDLKSGQTVVVSTENQSGRSVAATVSARTGSMSPGTTSPGSPSRPSPGGAPSAP